MQLVFFSSTFNAPCTYRKIRCDGYCSTFWENFSRTKQGLCDTAQRKAQVPVRLSYKLYFFSQRIVFFSHNKSVNGTFNHGLSAKQTAQRILSRLALAIITEYHAGAGLSLDASGLNGERSNVVIRVVSDTRKWGTPSKDRKTA